MNASRKRYKVTCQGKTWGPLTREAIKELYAAGKLPKTAKVQECTTFVPLDVPELEVAIEPAREVEPVLELAEDNTRPTERQIEYAEDLGITVRPWMTREQVSDLISAETEGEDYLERRPRHRHRPQQITGHVTTERTGKALKLHQLYAWAMFGIGLLVVWSAAATGGSSEDTAIMMAIGTLLIGGSMVYGIINRMAAWWHHG